MSDVSLLSGISGLFLDSPFLSPFLFFCLAMLLFLSCHFVCLLMVHSLNISLSLSLSLLFWGGGFLPEGWMKKCTVLIPLPSLIKKIVHSFVLSLFISLSLQNFFFFKERKKKLGIFCMALVMGVDRDYVLLAAMWHWYLPLCIVVVSVHSFFFLFSFFLLIVFILSFFSLKKINHFFIFFS